MKRNHKRKCILPTLFPRHLPVSRCHHFHFLPCTLIRHCHRTPGRNLIQCLHSLIHHFLCHRNLMSRNHHFLNPAPIQTINHPVLLISLLRLVLLRHILQKRAAGNFQRLLTAPGLLFLHHLRADLRETVSRTVPLNLLLKQLLGLIRIRILRNILVFLIQILQNLTICIRSRLHRKNRSACR